MNAIVKIGDSEYEPARLDRAGILALAESGMLTRMGRVEVLDGVLIQMSPSNVAHGLALVKVVAWCEKTFGGSFGVAVDVITTFGEHGMSAPDIAVFDPAATGTALDSADLHLAIEISDSSIKYDLEPKAQTYAAHGVPELWVVDLGSRELVVHREPSPDGYCSVTAQAWNDAASPLLAPDESLKLADIISS